MTASPILRVTVQNQKPNLKDLEQVYVPSFSSSREKKAALNLLSAVHKYCDISPYDATLTYPNGSQSLSSLGQLLTFFICDQTHNSEMPLDAPRFLAFLKRIRYKTDNLCMVSIGQ